MPDDSPSPPAPPASFAASLLGARAWLPLTVVFACGFVARMAGIGDSWTNPDEGIYYSMITWERWEDFWRECEGNAHPPLFYLVLRALSSAFDADFVALRYVSLVAGAAWIPAVFLLVREAGGGTRRATLAGLIAATLIAASPGSIMLSQVMRPYALLVAFLTFGLYYLFRYVRRGGRRAPVLYCVAMFLALLIHYSALLLLGAVGLGLVIMLVARRLDRRQATTLLLANAPLLVTFGALYVWHLSTLEGSELQQQAQNDWLRGFFRPGLTGQWLSLVGFSCAVFDQTWAGTAVLLFLGGLFVSARERDWLSTALPVSAFGIAAVLAATGKYPFGSSRHSFHLVAVLVLPIATALAHLLCARRPTAIATGIAAVALLFPDVRLAVSKLAVLTNPTGHWRMLSEQTVKTADVRAVQPELARLTRTPGTILISEETYFLLMPLYSRPRQGPTAQSTERYRRFRWGRKDVVVWRSWKFSTKVEDLGTERHLDGTLRALDKAAPDLGLRTSRDTIMIFGGWSFEAAKVLLSIEPRIAEEVVLRENFLVLQLDTQTVLQSPGEKR